MAVEDLGESLMFVSYISLVMAGVNIIWGMFLYPFGLLGFIFAAVDIVLFFLAKQAKDIYVARDYEGAKKKEYLVMLLGFIFGLVVIGAFAYPPYKELDRIVTKKYLVKAQPKQYYAPPQFPRKKS